MVFLNLQIKQIADGLTAIGWNPTALPANALVAYSATAPLSPTNGQLWLNSTTSVLNIYGGTSWQQVAISTAQNDLLIDLVTNGYYNKIQADNLYTQKQDTLLGGTNIKTINGVSPVGSGNMVISAPMGNLDSVSDVVITTPLAGQTVSYNGTAWINATPVSGVTDHTLLSNIGTRTHGQLESDIALKANIASPVFTGNVTGLGVATGASFNNITGLATVASPMDGIAAVGTGVTVARADHVHPVDTSRIALTEKGALNGVATLGANGLVPSTQLPAFVVSVLEFASLAGFPAGGTTGAIYVAKDTNKLYRWNGTVYVFITSGAVDSVAGKTGIVTLTAADVGLGLANNTSDASKPVSTATQTALDLKVSNNATKAINHARAAVISSATTSDIWSALGNQIDWTGTATTTIFPAAPQAGAERTLICAGASSFTAGANMLIDGVASGATVTCAVGDTVIVRAISTTQFKLTRVKADGTAQVAPISDTSQTLIDGVTISWDTLTGNIATVTLAGNRTMAAPTGLTVKTYILIVNQDATGSRLITWNAVFKWAAGSAPILSTAAGSKDVFSFFSDGTNLYGSYLRGVA